MAEIRDQRSDGISAGINVLVLELVGDLVRVGFMAVR